MTRKADETPASTDLQRAMKAASIWMLSSSTRALTLEETFDICRALLSLSSREEWQGIETAPVTVTDADKWAKIPVLVYGPDIGVCLGYLHRFAGAQARVSIAHLGGDAVENWGVTHFRPLPSPPSKGMG